MFTFSSNRFDESVDGATKVSIRRSRTSCVSKTRAHAGVKRSATGRTMTRNYTETSTRSGTGDKSDGLSVTRGWRLEFKVQQEHSLHPAAQSLEHYRQPSHETPVSCCRGGNKTEILREWFQTYFVSNINKHTLRQTTT